MSDIKKIKANNTEYDIAVDWGKVQGTLANQTDLSQALGTKLTADNLIEGDNITLDKTGGNVTISATATGGMTPDNFIEGENITLDKEGGNITISANSSGTSLVAGKGIEIDDTTHEISILQEETEESINLTKLGEDAEISDDDVISGCYRAGNNYHSYVIPKEFKLEEGHTADIIVKFKLNNLSKEQAILSLCTSNKKTFDPFYIIGSRLNFYYGNADGSNWVISSSNVALTLINGKTYRLKCHYDGDRTFTYYSREADDGEWSLIDTKTVTTSPSTVTQKWVFGINIRSGSSCIGDPDALYYPRETKILVDDEVFWEFEKTEAIETARATTELFGLVKPDGTTIKVKDGVISMIPGGGTVAAGNGLDFDDDGKLGINQKNTSQSINKVNLVGNATIDDNGILNCGGVSANYAYLENEFVHEGKPFEFVATIIIPQSGAVTEGGIYSQQYGIEPFYVYGTSGSHPSKLHTLISTNGSSWAFNEEIMTYQYGKTYTLKCTFDGVDTYDNYVWNETTETWDLLKSITGYGAPKDGLRINLNSNRRTAQLTTNVKIDLPKSYIKLDNQYFFKYDAAKDNIAKATSQLFGLVKPDNVTTTVVDGVISAIGGSGSTQATSKKLYHIWEYKHDYNSEGINWATASKYACSSKYALPVGEKSKMTLHFGSDYIGSNFRVDCLVGDANNLSNAYTGLTDGSKVNASSGNTLYTLRAYTTSNDTMDEEFAKDFCESLYFTYEENPEAETAVSALYADQASLVDSFRWKWPGGVIPRDISQFPVICHTSDTHSDALRVKRFADFADYIKADFACVTGDLVSSGPNSGYTALQRIVKDAKTKFVITTGNHDIGSSRSSASDTEQYNRMFKAIASNIGNTTQKTWYSVDNATKKLRMIAIDLYNYGGNGWNTYFTTDMMDYVIERLQTCPADYGVVLLYHEPFGTHAYTANYDKFYQKTRTYSGSMKNISGQPIYDLIDAWINRTTINKSYTHNNVVSGYPQTLTLTADFSDVPASCEFIAHLTGHLHQDTVTYAPGYTKKQLLLNVTCGNAWTGFSNYAYWADCGDIARDEHTRTQDCFNTYIIDRANKNLTIVRIGSDVTMDRTKRDYLTLPYAD